MIDVVNYINPNQKYVNEYKDMPGGFVASRYNVAATTYIAYAVYEKDFPQGNSFHNHHTISSVPGKEGRWGDLTTRDISPEIDALPVGEERSKLVRAHYASLKHIALDIVMTAFPQDFERI